MMLFLWRYSRARIIQATKNSEYLDYLWHFQEKRFHFRDGSGGHLPRDILVLGIKIVHLEKQTLY